MNDLNKDLSKRFLNFLDTKQYQRLQFEADMMGNIEDQDPLVMFYYASSIYLKESSEDKELLLASNLFGKVYNSNKKHMQSLYNMIAVSLKTKVFRDVMPLAMQAYKKNDKDVKLIEGLARINFHLGNRQDSIKLFKILYKLLPEKTEGRLPFISSLQYASGISQEEYLSECLNYSKLIEKKHNIENDNFKFINNNSGKIKLAFLSSDFKIHSVSHFLKKILQKIDKSSFEVILVSNLETSKQDEMSEVLKKSVYKWYDVEHYSDDELTTFLRSLNLDILIDLSGFTHGNRFEVVVRKCAKKQIGWLGYNNTQGIKNLDYLISDPHLIKKDELKFYTEEILFLPNIWNALAVPEKLPDINNDKKFENFTYCSFNNFQKLSDRSINVWSQILKISNTELILKDSLVGGEDLKNNVLTKFIKKGVRKDQIIFLNREDKIEDHLNIYNQANVALDTFPYPGVTTSCEAILMGVPVLTMKGFNFNSRCGESINKNIGLNYLIADDDNDYIEKAITLRSDKDLSSKYGQSLREKALKSPLFDTDTFVKDFENLLKKVIN